MHACTAIALSGGVDSLVSAALLKEQGHGLIALHFLTGYEQTCVAGAANGTNSAEGALLRQARQRLEPLAEQLGIPIHVIDLREEFQRLVVDYFTSTYARGKTPNPCLVCNPLIKFNILFKKAKKLGASRIATGHYARIEKAGDGRMRLLAGTDKYKDQSYFLSRLSQEQLCHIELPLGPFTKPQTFQMAQERGLRPVTSQESQDICFIQSGRYGDFLKSQRGFSSSAGPIEDMAGQQIGTHEGLHRFTVGQRRGINCPAAEPYYVVRLDADRNTLVVGGKPDLVRTACHVEAINWIAPPPNGPIDVRARIRYRHQAVAATLSPVAADRAELTFATAQSAVTPGQGAVFYRDDEVLGGGFIR